MPSYPLWFRIAVVSAFVFILIGVVVADYRSTQFEAQALALALVGVIGTVLGSDRFLKRGDGE